MKYILGFLLLLSCSTYAAPNKKIRKPQQVIGEFGKDKNLKPLLVQWFTGGCDDPADEGLTIIHDSETIAALKEALNKKTMLSDDLLKRLEVIFKPEETVTLDVVATEININLVDAQNYFMAKNKQGHPDITFEASQLLQIIIGNKTLKQYSADFNNPICD